MAKLLFDVPIVNCFQDISILNVRIHSDVVPCLRSWIDLAFPWFQKDCVWRVFAATNQH